VPVFKNVVIEGNTVAGSAGPQLVASSANGFTIRRNRFLSPQHDQPPETVELFHSQECGGLGGKMHQRSLRR
jgi:hypothetical protein